MKQIYKIDSKGYLLEVLIVQDSLKLPIDCVETKPQDGLHKPKWNGTKWIEGDIKSVLVLNQSVKKQSIKSSFNTTLKTGYITSKGIKMDATIQAISTLNAGHTLAVASGTTTMDIRDYDNVVHNGVAIADVQTMLVELGSNYQVQLNKKWALEAQVKACTTQADLDKIVW